MENKIERTEDQVFMQNDIGLKKSGMLGGMDFEHTLQRELSTSYTSIRQALDTWNRLNILLSAMPEYRNKSWEICKSLLIAGEGVQSMFQSLQKMPMKITKW